MKVKNGILPSGIYKLNVMIRDPALAGWKPQTSRATALFLKTVPWNT